MAGLSYKLTSSYCDNNEFSKLKGGASLSHMDPSLSQSIHSVTHLIPSFDIADKQLKI